MSQTDTAVAAAQGGPASPATPPPARRTHLDAWAVLLLFGCCALWGMTQVAIKLALPEVGPLAQNMLRNIVAAALILAWMRWRGIGFGVKDGMLAPGLLVGGLFALEFACLFSALAFTTAARGTVFINSSPLIVAVLLALLVPAERLKPLQIGGLLLAFAALAYAFSDAFSGASLPGQWRGDALMLLAAVLWGLTTVVIRVSRLRHAPAETTLAYQLCAAAVLGPIMWGISSEPWPAQWSWVSIGSLAYQAVIVTFVSYLVWFWLLTRYPATRVQSFALLSPVFGVLGAGLILSEPIGHKLVIALGAILLGIVLLNRRTSS
jgi:drug/metabolite transporter (DMT)-like permease